MPPYIPPSKEWHHGFLSPSRSFPLGPPPTDLALPGDNTYQKCIVPSPFPVLSGRLLKMGKTELPAMLLDNLPFL